MRQLVALVALLTIVFVIGAASGVARADESPDEEIARRHFEEGERAYAERDYARAVREFEAARTVRPSAALDYDIARSYDRMERPAEAILAYERFLAQAPPG